MSRVQTESKLFHGYFSTTTSTLAFMAPYSLAITKIELFRHADYAMDENVYFRVIRDGTEVSSALWQFGQGLRRYTIDTALPRYMQAGDSLHIDMDGSFTPLDPPVSVVLEYENV